MAKKKKLDAKFYGQVALVALGGYGLAKLTLKDSLSGPAAAAAVGIAGVLLGPKMAKDYKKHGSVFQPYIDLS